MVQGSAGASLIGQRVGDYRLDAVLGEGGMGVVFRGVHDVLGQIIAIKMLHPDLVSEPKIKERFVREAQALARLNHPNIVRLINFVDRPDTCFIFMEFIEGRTLDKILAERGVIPGVEAAEWYQEVLAAMHYAHGLGIVHRDIKPSNVCILNLNGMVKVLDFGTAKMVGAERLTQEGMTLGTLIYMSPEQITGRELDQRSDIYSLGVTLYELVTGKLPHDDPDEMALVRAIARGVPKPPSAHYGGVPKRLEKIIMRSIEKDPKKRYSTAEEFLKDVKSFLDEVHLKQKKQTPPSGTRRIVNLDKVPDPPPCPPPQPQESVGEETTATPPPRTGFFKRLVRKMWAKKRGGVPLPGSISQDQRGPEASPPPPPIAPVPPPPPPPPAAQPQPGGGSATPRVRPPLPQPANWAPPPVAPPAGGSAQQPEINTWRTREPKADAPRAAVPAPSMGGSRAYLCVLDGSDKGRAWPLTQGAITIGRGPHNTIVLTDPGVSTSHAQIGYDGRAYVLADLQSRNGCYVNNKRVATATLRDRDVLVLGTTQIAVSINEN